MDNELVS